MILKLNILILFIDQMLLRPRTTDGDGAPRREALWFDVIPL